MFNSRRNLWALPTSKFSFRAMATTEPPTPRSSQWREPGAARSLGARRRTTSNLAIQSRRSASACVPAAFSCLGQIVRKRFKVGRDLRFLPPGYSNTLTLLSPTQLGKIRQLERSSEIILWSRSQGRDLPELRLAKRIQLQII